MKKKNKKYIFDDQLYGLLFDAKEELEKQLSFNEYLVKVIQLGRNKKDFHILRDLGYVDDPENVIIGYYRLSSKGNKCFYDHKPLEIVIEENFIINKLIPKLREEKIKTVHLNTVYSGIRELSQ